MRLLSQNWVLLFAVSTLACGDPVGPLGSQRFVLHDVNGRSLPTYLTATPGLTTTVVSGSLTFSGTNHVLMVDHRIDEAGTETDITSSFTYRITGTKIDFEPVNVCLDLCPAPPVGTVTTFGMSVDLVPWQPGFIVYDYASQ